jgi:hypothetical protein
MEALGGGRIAPTHTRPRHYMGVSNQYHTPAALYPRERNPSTHCTEGWVEPVWTQRLQEKRKKRKEGVKMSITL